jgi:AcrR family transcriptional regulator
MSQQTETPANAEKILDAAKKCVLNVGLSRTTLTDVAKTAGLSRMTVYRSYPSVEAILQDLMTREFNGVVGESIEFDFQEGEFTITRAQLVESIVTALEGLTSHPLFARILSTDPELLLPYITERPGRFQQNAEDVLATGIGVGIAGGEIRDDDPRRLAASMMLATRGYALIDKSGWSRPHRARMLEDLRTMFDLLLAPEGQR